MQTLVELYVNEQFDDLAATLAFRPARTVFLTTGPIPPKAVRDGLLRFIRSVRADAEVEFVEVGNRSVDSIFAKTAEVFERYPDCAVELTGGSPAVLVAAQGCCRRRRIRAFYYDDRRGRFRSICRMKDELEKIELPKLDAGLLISMGGGKYTGNGHSVKPLDANYDCIKAVLEVYRRNLERWNAFSEYLQFACRNYCDYHKRYFCAPMALLNKHNLLFANRSILRGLAEAGALTELASDGENVSFFFKNDYVREVLTTVGMCLELFVYLAAKESGEFDSADMSVEFDWDGVIQGGFNDTVNELDVVLTKGLTSRIVSCKSARPSTGDLYEISYIASRFGGRHAKAVLATAAELSSDYWAAYMRARDMGIIVIERSDIVMGPERVVELLKEPVWLGERPKVTV